MVTKDMTIGEILRTVNGADEVLRRNGMHCVGCPSAQMESIADACVVHGMDINKVLSEHNAL